MNRIRQHETSCMTGVPTAGDVAAHRAPEAREALGEVVLTAGSRAGRGA